MKLPLRCPVTAMDDWLIRKGWLSARYARGPIGRKLVDWYWTTMLAMVCALVAARAVLYFAVCE